MRTLLESSPIQTLKKGNAVDNTDSLLITATAAIAAEGNVNRVATPNALEREDFGKLMKPQALTEVTKEIKQLGNGIA